MKLTILGQAPSQKNSKTVGRNRYTGKIFVTSNSRVKSWQQSALSQLRDFDHKFKGRVQIDYMFYVKDNVQRDTDNMIASVNDVLQEANSDVKLVNGKAKPVKGTGIIQGDHWQMLRIGSADAAIDKENPRTELIITELG